MTRRSTVVFCILALAVPAVAGAKIDSNTFGDLEARSIGPASMSGRIAALAVAPGNPPAIYAGAATGGVWKSSDAGVSWEPVFDEHTQSIGAVAIDPQRPDTIWVGTGESWTRNSVSVGDGVYRSTDGGDSWEHLGLTDSERIARIVTVPEDADTVYVCATGHLWNANDERGVYKTTDGGKTWEQVLWVDEDTGCSDLAIDPADSSILYAGMWQFRRQPWTFSSGGPGSGLYKTSDGGETWREITSGLPEGDKGRIAVAVAPSRPRTVYAVVEAETTGLYRSDDLGESWELLNTGLAVQGRPFYFAYLVVDPVNPERVYKPGFNLAVSDDGGKTFSGTAGSNHADHHALWVNPDDPNHLILGTDGGVYISWDRANNFRFIGALPLSQFYEIGVDLEDPYNVYGGLQDNGSWMGPSAATGSIQNKHWDNVGFGDGFHVYADPSEPDYVYSEYQGGFINRINKKTGEARDVKPLPKAGEPDYRFNWNAPIHMSPNNPGTIYFGAQFLFRSTDRGESWERISPDLTTNDPAKQRQEESGGLTIDNSTAENHTTLYTIAESPADADVIWAGTDDGNLQVTRDGGATWTNVVGNVPDLPANTWVTHVEASRHGPGRAYATFDGHRTGDMATYVYKTTDYGATWTSLVTDEIDGYALVVIDDPVEPNLLFLGTERGLYVSIDGGGSWARFKGNLPKVGVRALVIHPREQDLVIGTHGRGVYILDDVTPLRHLSDEVLEADVAFLPTRPGRLRVPAAIQSFPGDDEFFGSNPADGVSIVYYQKKRHLFGDLRIEIYDLDDNLISTLPASKRKGLNRVHWSARRKPPKTPPATTLVFQPFSFLGPLAPFGEYKVKLIKGKKTYETRISLGGDPRATHTAEDRALQQEKAQVLYDDLADLTYVVEAVNDLRDQARARAGELGGRDRTARELKSLADDLAALRGTLVATSAAGRLSGQERLREKLVYLYGAINGYAGRPSQSQLDQIGVLQDELAAARGRFDGLVASRVERLNSLLARRDLDKLEVMTREAWEDDDSSGGAGPMATPALAKRLARHLSRVPLTR